MGSANPRNMSSDDIPQELISLVEKMHDDYTQSELDIALALAEVDDAVSIQDLAETVGYTERTIKKRVGTLEERLGGSPLITRTENDAPQLHPAFANALRAVEPAE